jgi:hypothetical protein
MVPAIGGRELGAAELGAAAVSADRTEKEFWVATPEEATGAANDTFLCFLGIF